MTRQPDPGWTLPNRFGRALLVEFERLLGTNGFVAVLKLSGLSIRGETPPADDLELGFRFSEAAALYRGLEGVYGERGARGLIRQANREAFNRLWVDSGGFADLIEAATTALPPGNENERGWTALVKVFAEISDLKFDVFSEGSALQLNLSQCPDCLDHRSQDACCTGMLGWLEGAHAILHPRTSARIHERECQAAGANVCTFVIKTPDDA